VSYLEEMKGNKGPSLAKERKQKGSRSEDARSRKVGYPDHEKRVDKDHKGGCYRRGPQAFVLERRTKTAKSGRWEGQRLTLKSPKKVRQKWKFIKKKGWTAAVRCTASVTKTARRTAPPGVEIGKKAPSLEIEEKR